MVEIGTGLFKSPSGLVEWRVIGRTTYQRLTYAVHSSMPRGGELPTEEWERRHRAMTRLLWGAAVAIAVYSVLSGYAAWHVGVDASAVVVAGLWAGYSPGAGGGCVHWRAPSAC